MSYPLETAFHITLKQQNVKKTTIRNYDTTLNQFFTFLENQLQIGGEEALSRITENDLRAFFDQQNMTLGTYNKKLSHLNQYFLFLFNHRFIDRLPTLPLHGHAVPSTKKADINWLDYLPGVLTNNNLHLYTRVTLLLLSHGYDIQEILKPGFYQVFTATKFTNPTEQHFIAEFKGFIEPLQKKQQSHNLFLKQRINRQNPLMSLAGLHKYLRADQNQLPFSLVPQRLHRDYILKQIQAHPEMSSSALSQSLRLSPQSLNYYQNLLIHSQNQKKVITKSQMDC